MTDNDHGDWMTGQFKEAAKHRAKLNTKIDKMLAEPLPKYVSHVKGKMSMFAIFKKEFSELNSIFNIVGKIMFFPFILLFACMYSVMETFFYKDF